MKKLFTILIADKNSNVLSFLKRELVKENYQVLTVLNTKALIEILSLGDKPDLLIVDPVLPGLDLYVLLKELSGIQPKIRVVIHDYFSDFYDHPSITGDVFFIEREGGSIENIKKIIAHIIKNQTTEYI